MYVYNKYITKEKYHKVNLDIIGNEDTYNTMYLLTYIEFSLF